MATIGYAVLIGGNVSDDKKADLTSRVLQVLQSESLSVVYETYDAGSTSKNEASITVGTGAVDAGIRIVMDSAGVGTNKVADILQRLIAVLLTETIVLSHAVSYVEGDRVYNLTITVT